MKRIVFILAAVLVWGCRPFAPVADDKPAAPRLEPLAIQQKRAYPETVTRMFVPLVDFEDSPGGPRGFEQIDYFAVRPARASQSSTGRTGWRRFVVNITRTGTGAMEVTLGPRSQLVFTSPEVHDFTGYTLVTMALYSEAPRDDLRVTLVSRSGAWTSPLALVVPGWNNVLIDIQRLVKRPGFDVGRVREIRIAFADAVGDVTFNLDDIMLIDNRRQLQPTPPGIKLWKRGLDYRLSLPARTRDLLLQQGLDGLWRLSESQAAVRLAGPGKGLESGGEDLALMGARKVGHVKVAELNAIRLRLVNTWYFPTRAGEWASLAIRRIRWEHTFYADGRWVTGVELNNAGGQRIAAAGLFLDESVAWDDGAVGDARTEPNFAGPVARWNYLRAPRGPNHDAIARSYMSPGRIEVHMGDAKAFAPGDANQDRFNETRGCYFLRANRAGHCRFTFHPGPGGAYSPVFRVAGRWDRRVSVNCAGMAIRKPVLLSDGSVLFVVDAHVTRPTRIEVTGRPAVSAAEE